MAAQDELATLLDQRTHERPMQVKVTPSRTALPGDLACEECGEVNPPDRRFCRRCGASLASAVPAASKRSSLGRLAWAVAVAVIAVVGAAWWLVR